jgi:hypothetical protein
VRNRALAVREAHHANKQAVYGSSPTGLQSVQFRVSPAKKVRDLVGIVGLWVAMRDARRG